MSTFKQSLPNKIGKVGEKKLQKKMGGKLTPGSRGGDLVYNQYVLVENKSTDKKSISLKKDYLDKIDRIAFEGGKHPVLVVGFEATSKNYGEREWAVVPLNFLIELLEKHDF